MQNALLEMPKSRIATQFMTKNMFFSSSKLKTITHFVDVLIPSMLTTEKRDFAEPEPVIDDEIDLLHPGKVFFEEKTGLTQRKLWGIHGHFLKPP